MIYRLVALASIVICSQANAADLWASVRLNPENFAGGTLPPVCSDFVTVSTEISCNGSYSVGGGSFSYASMFLADYGVLKASTLASTTIAPTIPTSGVKSFFVQSDGWFRDQWTISGQPLGESGTLRLTFKMDGEHLSGMPGTRAGWGLAMTTLGPGGQSYNFDPGFQSTQSPEIIDTRFAVEVPITFGSSLDFRVSLLFYSKILDINSAYVGQSTYSDFSHTFYMDSMDIFGSSGEAVAFDLVTASGSEFFDNLASMAQPVPEPNSAILMLIGGIIFIGSRGLRKSIDRQP